MQHAQCVEACLKTFSALLSTPLLSSSPVVLVVETSILKAFSVPFTVVFGFKNSNVAMVSRPHVWLESPPSGAVTDLGMSTCTDNISVCGSSFGFVPTASDVTYTSDVSGPVYRVPEECGHLDKLRRLVKTLQQDGVDKFVKKLGGQYEAALAAALQCANDPAARIAFAGSSPALCGAPHAM